MCVHIYTTHAYGSTTKITNRAWHIVEILGKTDKIKQANQKLKTKQKPLTYMFTADPWYHLKTSPQAISVYWHSRIIRMAQCNTDLTAGAWTTEQRISKALGNQLEKVRLPHFLQIPDCFYTYSQSSCYQPFILLCRSDRRKDRTKTPTWSITVFVMMTGDL